MSKKLWMAEKLQKLLFTYNPNKIFKVAWGGRYGSKTMAFESAAIKYVLENPGSIFLCVRGTQTSISNSLLKGIKKMIYMMGVEDLFDIGQNYIKTVPDENGIFSEFIFMGAVAYESFRSLEGVNVAWIDEAHVIKEDAWDVLIPSVRGKNSEIWITFNAKRKTDWVYDNFIIKNDPLADVVKINYQENVMLPDRERMKADSEKTKSERKYRHIYLGELDDMPEDALWKQEQFIYRDVELEELDRIIVAVDPAGDKNTKSSDECGLVVAGTMAETGYILEDATEKLSQLNQAKKAIKLYNKYKADYIIVEKNGVGAGMKTIIHQIDKSILVKEVDARRGKILRAEPVAALYEADRVYHKEVFTNLEYEMTSYTGDPKEKSPNSLDAMVYCILELMVKKRVNIPGQSTTNNKNKSINQKTNKTISPFKFQI